MKNFIIQWFGLPVLLAGLSLTVEAQARTCDQHSPDILRYKASEYQKVIDSAASMYGVSADLINAVITAETCFRPAAVSPKGAKGLMQLMPATARRFGVTDRSNITQNIHAGTRYLGWLLRRYNGSVYHAVAAYNAGEGTIDEHGLDVPFNETRVYVGRVINAYKKLVASPEVAGGTQQYAQVAKAQSKDTVLKPEVRERVLKPKVSERKLVSKAIEKRLLPSCMTASRQLHKSTYHRDKKGDRTFFYTVQKNDTIEKIMKLTGSSETMIKRYNDIRRSLIKPGQKLKVSECRLK